MSMSRWVVSSMLTGVLCAGAWGQAVPPVRERGVPAPRRVRQEPCWQVAGISRSAMQQVRSLRQQARMDIQGVCANSSLSPRQKHQQIREIREKERQQVDALISPAQEQARRACRQERGIGAHAGGGIRAGGPCGEMPSGKKAPPEPEREE
jgi:TolA-binding protein